VFLKSVVPYGGDLSVVFLGGFYLSDLEYIPFLNVIARLYSTVVTGASMGVGFAPVCVSLCVRFLVTVFLASYG
jgi:hypothetical protein